MPVYDYLCDDCGPFTETRPMALSAAACGCPDCGTDAPRAFLTAPRLLGMDAASRTAHAVNEKSRHEPKSSRALDKAHPAGCGCCSGKSKKGVYTADGTKTFPSARPWMISH